MLAAGIKSSAQLTELENHLREDIGLRMKSGLAAQNAFETAVQEIGKADMLKNEFKKIGGTPVMLTEGSGTNESPSWSPDGRYIAFSSTRGGRSRIYILQVETRKIISPLTEGNGNDTNPAWSWWLGD